MIWVHFQCIGRSVHNDLWGRIRMDYGYWFSIMTKIFYLLSQMSLSAVYCIQRDIDRISVLSPIMIFSFGILSWGNASFRKNNATLFPNRIQYFSLLLLIKLIILELTCFLLSDKSNSKQHTDTFHSIGTWIEANRNI